MQGHGLTPTGLVEARPAAVRSRDDIAFEFGQSREHVEDQFPAAGCCVNALLKAPEADPPFLELADGLDEMPDATAQAVELPTTRVAPSLRCERAR